MAPWSVRVEGGFGNYRWFVYITTLLLREASLLLYCIVGHRNPASATSILLVLSERHCFKYERYNINLINTFFRKEYQPVSRELFYSVKHLSNSCLSKITLSMSEIRKKINLYVFFGVIFKLWRHACYRLYRARDIGTTSRFSLDNVRVTIWGGSCGRADSVMDSHTTGPRFQTGLVWYFLPRFQLTITITASWSWAFACVCGRPEKDFPVGSYPRH